MLTYIKVERIIKNIKDLILSDNKTLNEFRIKFTEDGPEKILKDNFDNWDIFNPDNRWGEYNTHAWFFKRFRVPKEWAGKTLALKVSTGHEGEWDATNPQFLLFINKSIAQGLDTNHTLAIITESANPDMEYELLFWGYTGHKVRQVSFICNISILNRDIEKLYYDLKVPLDVANFLPEDDVRKITIIEYLDKAVNMLDMRIPYSSTFHNSVVKSIEYLENNFYNDYCSEQKVKVSCVGHTHIDVAWLWTVKQTKEKTARSFSTALKLMNEYKNFIFMYSQPVLYGFIKEEYPELFKELKERIKEGRWETEGAMWLESDINLPSGESIIRQILYGKRFFKKEFGIENEILWLPDVFGYSASLPQILKKSGIKYFVTTKLSWNQFNKIPYDTFFWRGIDGSEILTYFITATDYNSKSFQTNYNATLNPSQVMGAWKRYQQKNLNKEIFICYGYGDGGGGPTREMLENAKRMARGIPGCPQVKLEKAGDFFKKLEQNLNDKRDTVPKWIGELYLELHRGTYTSMAKNKRLNRKAEILLNELEFISSLAMILGFEYPSNELHRLWERILLNQFHDILPGSSIKDVYDDSWKDYDYVFKRGVELLFLSWKNIFSKINLAKPCLIVSNNTSNTRNGIVKLDDSFQMNTELKTEDISIIDGRNGNCEIPLQEVINENGKHEIIFLAKDIPAKGFKCFYFKSNNQKNQKQRVEKQSSLTVNKSYLENSFFKIHLNDRGEFVSFFDKKANREILAHGKKGNVLQAFEDKPQNWDSWDIDPYYIDKMWEVDSVEKIEVLEKGPVRGSLLVIKHFLNSTIKQRIIIYNDIPRIDFENIVDWQEKQILLKVAFPVDINSNKATYDIQFGNIERPTHWNTSWERAKFEVCAHKWADLSESGYGVSLLNDCKYGYDIKDNVIRLTLIKSGIEPNPEADLGEHRFIYSIYPHTGSWLEGKTVQMAYNLNYPLRALLFDSQIKHSKLKKNIISDTFSLISVDRPNIIVETIKKAEDDSSILVRMYENHNRRGYVKITFGFKLARATECDLLENELQTLKPLTDNVLQVYFKPYEIKTFKVDFEF